MEELELQLEELEELEDDWNKSGIVASQLSKASPPCGISDLEAMCASVSLRRSDLEAMTAMVVLPADDATTPQLCPDHAASLSLFLPLPSLCFLGSGSSKIPLPHRFSVGVSFADKSDSCSWELAAATTASKKA